MPLHPQVQAFLEALAAQNRPGWETMPPEESRRLFASFTEVFGAPPPIHEARDEVIAEDIPVRVYRPREAADASPAVMYFHGGGWVLGDVQTHDTLCRHLATASSCVVVSVDYRRAPEDPYPAAFNDCYEATEYVRDHAVQFGIDAGRLAVAGDSAGGNLAAAVALKARDVQGPPLAAQLLIYPVTEPRFDTDSYKQFAEGYGLTRDSMRWFWQQYLGDKMGASDACAAPVFAESLAGLPPAHVVTAEYDVLRDEGEQFARKLQAAGVPTTLRRYDGMMHGFVHFSGIFDVGRQAIVDVGDVLRTMLH